MRTSSRERRSTRLNSSSSVTTAVRPVSHSSGLGRDAAGRARALAAAPGSMSSSAYRSSIVSRAARRQVEREAQRAGPVARQGRPVGADRRRPQAAVAPQRREAHPVRQALDLRLARRPPADQAADGEHGGEVGGERELDVEPHALARVGVHQQRLRHGVARPDPALEADPQALEREDAAAGEREGRVGQLVERIRAPRGRRDEQPRRRAADGQLVA